MNTMSPLRYPGGKGALADLLAQVIELNSLNRCCFVEPFCGGAGAALTLLHNEYVDRIILNDLDPAIAAFWRALLYDTDRFIRRLERTPVKADEWRRQKEIYRRGWRNASDLDLGFAAFYLNRCNRSGIISNGGMIGGIAQDGRWKLDARFDKQRLRNRLEAVAEMRDRIAVSQMDAIELLQLGQASINEGFDEELLCFIDPPYIAKGGALYLNAMTEDEHRELAEFLQRGSSFRWVVTYDDCELVQHLYAGCSRRPFGVRYTAALRKTGAEVLVASSNTRLPQSQESLRIGW